LFSSGPHGNIVWTQERKLEAIKHHQEWAEKGNKDSQYFLANV
jgi:hypothetical protein